MKNLRSAIGLDGIDRDMESGDHLMFSPMDEP